MRFGKVFTASRRTVQSAMMIALVLSAPIARALEAQGHVDVSFSPSTAFTTPGGTEIEAGATQTITVTANVTTCSHFPCTVYLKTNQTTVTRPVGAATSLEYCLLNCASAASWSAVPVHTVANDDGTLIGSVSSVPSPVTFQLRYRLGWAGAPFFSPPGSYSLPIFLSLKN
jgi:hypothetical protein